MLITLFFERCKDEETAKELTKSFISMSEDHNIKTTVISIKEYWKIDEMFKVRLDAGDIQGKEFELYLEVIASNWQELYKELLASKTMEECIKY